MKGATESASRQCDLLLRAGSTMGLSDEQLLARFQAREGDVSAIAFEALMRRHGPMVLATCRGALRDEHDAEDAFQATFLILARKAESLRRGDRLGPWLHRVALRTAELVRSTAARRRNREAEAAERAPAVAPGPEWSVQREELCRAVHQEVDRLPERYRAVVVLCDLEGESYEVAAGQLRVPVGTVRSRLSRARERLRLRFDHRGLALPASLGLGVGTGAILAEAAARAADYSALPSHVITTCVQMAALPPASGLAAAGTATVPAAFAYAQEMLQASGWIGLGKAAGVLAVVAIGVAGAGFGLVALRGRAQPAPAPAPAPAARPLANAAPVPAAAPLRLGLGPEYHDSLPPDAALLQGRWIIREAFQFGAPLDLVVGDQLLIEGQRFTWTAARGEPQRIYRRGNTRGTIALDPGANPPRIDLIEPDRLVPAIYRLEENGVRLRLCVGDPDRSAGPGSFASEPGSRQLLLVLHHDVPGALFRKEQAAPSPHDVDVDVDVQGEPRR